MTVARERDGSACSRGGPRDGGPSGTPSQRPSRPVPELHGTSGRPRDLVSDSRSSHVPSNRPTTGRATRRTHTPGDGHGRKEGRKERLFANQDRGRSRTHKRAPSSPPRAGSETDKTGRLGAARERVSGGSERRGLAGGRAGPLTAPHQAGYGPTGTRGASGASQPRQPPAGPPVPRLERSSKARAASAPAGPSAARPAQGRRPPSPRSGSSARGGPGSCLPDSGATRAPPSGRVSGNTPGPGPRAAAPSGLGTECWSTRPGCHPTLASRLPARKHRLPRSLQLQIPVIEPLADAV